MEKTANDKSGSTMKPGGYGPGKAYPGGKITSKSTKGNLHPMKTPSAKPNM